MTQKNTYFLLHGAPYTSNISSWQPPRYCSEFTFLQMETGCQLVPKMFSVIFLSGFCPQTKAREQIIHRRLMQEPGRVAQSVGHLTRKSGVLGSIPGLATYVRFSFCFFKKDSCQLLAKVCARSTGSPLRRSKPAQEKCG